MEHPIKIHDLGGFPPIFWKHPYTNPMNPMGIDKIIMVIHRLFLDIFVGTSRGSEGLQKRCRLHGILKDGGVVDVDVRNVPKTDQSHLLTTIDLRGPP